MAQPVLTHEIAAPLPEGVAIKIEADGAGREYLIFTIADTGNFFDLTEGLRAIASRLLAL